MIKTGVEAPTKKSLRIRKRKRDRILTVFLAVVLFLVSGWVFIQSQLAPYDLRAEAVEIVIPPGSTTGAIAVLLKEKHVIRSEPAFRLYAKITGTDRMMKPGYYTVSPGSTLPEIIQKLVEGRVQEVEFTVPEGYNIQQIATLLHQKGIVEKQEFFNAATESFPFDFLKEAQPGEKQLEGFLFPDTYRVNRGASPREIIMTMLSRFEQVYKELLQEEGITAEYNTMETVILASIIEREARLDEERPIVASVFINRLKIGMRLESCATVEYVLPESKPVLTYRDLEVDSPYNTYRVDGLPPGPIANPGRASLLAALRPDKTDYLFFVAKPDGSHYFSRTLSEHNWAKARYQNLLKN